MELSQRQFHFSFKTIVCIPHKRLFLYNHQVAHNVQENNAYNYNMIDPIPLDISLSLFASCV